jgi:transcriptional regulator with AAA-type ATPase domain/TolB-like protein
MTVDRLRDLRGDSPGLTRIREQIVRLLDRHDRKRLLPPVLIHGETGTGKTLLARTIHGASARAAGPFIAVNCAAIPESLLESELFGHERGAFTGAHQAKRGLFQAAHGGVLFLDEIGAMPPALQAKVLTVVEDRSVRRLGSTQGEPVDLWLLSATSEDLLAAIKERRFREDLYHRLATIVLVMPALRERRADIVSLAEHFLAEACAKYVLPPKRLTDQARAALLAHPWPGNVREVANVMERVALLVDEVAVTAAHLGLSPTTAAPAAPGSLRDSVDDFERVRIASTLRDVSGNLSQAAARLGIPRNTLRYRMAKHGIGGGRPGPPAPTRPRHPTPSEGGADGGRTQATAATPGTRGLAFLWMRVASREGDDVRSSQLAEALAVIGDKVAAFGGAVLDRSTDALVAAFGADGQPDPALRALRVVKAGEASVAVSPIGLPVQAVIHFAECRMNGDGSIREADRGQALRILDDHRRHIGGDALVLTSAALPFLQREVGAHAGPAGDVPTAGHGGAHLEVTPRRPSIAVLPFRNLSDDKDEEYFGEGITDDIVGGLARLHWLFVIARQSTLRYKVRTAAARQIAAELGVRYLLGGTVRRMGDRLRVTAHLIDAEAGNTMWADRYDGHMNDLFSFQDRITASTVGALDTRLRLHESDLVMRKRPENLDSYDCVLRALHFFYRSSRGEFLNAGALLDRAIQLDATSARAHAWRAWWFNRLVGQGWSTAPDDDRRQAVTLAEAALVCDPEDPFALAVAGHVAAFLQGDLDTAQRRLERSLEISPNSAFSWGISAATYCYLNEPRAALDRVAYALRLSPSDPMNFSFTGLAAFAEMLAGNFESAVEWARRSHRQNPAFSATLRVLAASLAELGQVEKARAEVKKLLEIEPHFSLRVFEQRYPLRDRPALARYVDALRRAGAPA